MFMLLASGVGIAIDVAIVVLVALFALIGFKKGFFKSVISMISTLVILIVSILCASPLAKLINKIYDFTGLIAGKLTKAIASMGSFYSQEIPAGVSGSDIAGSIPSSTNGFLKKLMSYVLKPLKASEIEGETVAEIVSGAFASIIMVIIAGILLFIALKIVIAIASRLFDNITRNRVFGATNKFLGFAFGAVKGFLIVIVFTIVLTFMTVVPFVNTKLTPIIQDNTKIAKPIYNYTDEMVEKYIVDGKVIQKWIDNLWENKYKDKDDKPEIVLPDGTLEKPYPLIITESEPGVFEITLLFDFEQAEYVYYKLNANTVGATFDIELNTTLDYEIYEASNTDEPLTEFTGLQDSSNYLIKFVKNGEQTSASVNVTLTKNNT